MHARSLFVLAALAVGCAQSPDESVTTAAQPVVAGSPTPDELDFDIDRFQRGAVVGQLVRYGGNDYQGCSGTVVGDRVVVSAAHCVVMNQNQWVYGADPELPDPATLFYAVGDDVRSPSCLLGAQSVQVHPDARVTAQGAIAHDMSLIVLAQSVIETCPAVVPVQLNRDAIPEAFVGQLFLQGGFGSVDASYDFSPVRYWSLLRMTAVGEDYVMVAPESGFPSFGDSGSGLLRRYDDGSLRTIGMASVGGGTLMGFVRTDPQGSFVDQVVTPEVLCGSVGAAGICRDGAVVACGPSGFTSEDCTAQGLECVVDGAGQAACVDPGASDCGDDCQVCHTETGSGCSLVAPGRGSGASVLGCACLLGAIVGLRRRWRRAALGVGLLAGAGVLAAQGCAGDPETVCTSVGAPTGAGGAGGAAGTGGAATGGALPDTCDTLDDLLDPAACGEGRACDIADFLAMTVGCRPAGTTAAYELCSAATPPCEAGTTCSGLDPAAERCLPYCDEDIGQCPGDGVCLLAMDQTSHILKCLAPDGCDVLTQEPCNRQFGLACYFIDDTANTYCLYEGSRSAGASCTSPEQCRPGYGCVGSNPSICAKWCTEPDDCTGAATCLGIGDIPGHAELGYCGEEGGAGGAGGGDTGGAGGAGGAPGGAGGTGG